MTWMGLWKGGTSLGAQQAPWPEWAGQLPSAPTLGGPLPPASPELPASGTLILSGLQFSSPPQSPYVLPICLGVPPCSLGIRVHQQLADALAMGRC